MKIAVFGATGIVGRALLPVLAAEHDVLAVSRRRRPPEDGMTWAVADVLDGPSVRRALEGADVAYYLVHSLGTQDFEERDIRAATTFAREAAASHVKQLVYLGGLGEDGDELSPHLRSRLETGRALASGAVPLTTLQAAVVIGKGSAAFETVVALVDRLPVMIAPRWVTTPTQPVALEDAVRYLAGVAGREEAFGETYDLGGPEVMTYREMIERVARLRGKRRTDRRGARPHAVSLVALAAPRHAGRCVGRSSARGGAPQPDGRARTSASASSSRSGGRRSTRRRATRYASSRWFPDGSRTTAEILRLLAGVSATRRTTSSRASGSRKDDGRSSQRCGSLGRR